MPTWDCYFKSKEEITCFARLHGVVFEILIEDDFRMKIVGLMRIGHVTPKKICFSQAWNPKQPFFNGCLVISNHFPSKGLESSN